jgi:hypothetical protein
MPRLPRAEKWRPARDIPFLVLCVAVATGMMRAVDQPSAEVSAFGTEVSIVPADVAVAALAALSVARLLGSGALPRPAWALTASGAAFAAWLLLSSAANGADAVVGAAKVLEYGVIALGAVLFVRRRGQVWALVGLLVALTVIAVVVAGVDFVETGLRRQGSYLGPHDFAALSTMSLVVGIVAFYVRAPRRLALVAVIAGGLGVVLGAALAGLLGLFLGVAAIVRLAAVRAELTRRALALTMAVLVLVTAGVLALRLGDFGVGDQPEDEGVTGGSWRQRLIYVYVGGRIFLDNPVVGTGWHGELPPEEFAEYVPDARRAFPDEPVHYFPSPPGTFLPQQTYDQVLYELGLVGAALFLLLGALTVRTVARVGSAWPDGHPDGALAYLPAAWVGSLAGALAGAALFGGNPLTAMFWLTLGVAALAPSLVPPSRASAPAEGRREPATVA